MVVLGALHEGTHELSAQDTPKQVEYLFSFGRHGTGPGQFDRAVGIGVNNIGDVYVTDPGNGRVQVFDKTGAFRFAFGDGEFDTPVAIAFDSDNNVYITDFQLSRAQVFDQEGLFLFTIELEEGLQPFGVAVDDDGLVFIGSDVGILTYDQHGQFRSVFEFFNTPRQMEFDVDGNLYVTDRVSHAINVFDPEGNLEFSFGEQGAGDGQFETPLDVAFDDAARVYVTDRDNHRVQVFDHDGNYQFAFGSFGSGPGLFNAPTGIAIDGQRIFVTDRFNDRVSVWQIVSDAIACDFDENGSLDVADIDLLLKAVKSESNDPKYDVNADGTLNRDDIRVFVESPDRFNSYIGDANLDGEFNTSDLVVLFVAGEYEDAIAGNSTWASGDWDGDGEFTTSDFAWAFQGGGYERGSREAVGAVPEPATSHLIIAALLGVLWKSTRRLRMGGHASRL